MTAITINLREPKLLQLEQAAIRLNKPTSELLSDMVLATLPHIDDVPDEMKVELLQMTWSDTPRLWRIAESQMDFNEQQRMQLLVQQKMVDGLTESEEDELEELQRQYGRVTLRKAHAYMLLSLRGGKPILKNNEL